MDRGGIVGGMLPETGLNTGVCDLISDAGKLTAMKVKSAKPGKHFDGGGLYLHVQPKGRYWRLKYRHAGKEKLLALGVYPEVGLGEARRRRDDARGMLRDGLDPSAQRKQNRLNAVQVSENTFGNIATEWLQKQAPGMASVTYDKAKWLLSLAGGLATRPIAEITAREIYTLLKPLEAAGTLETAHRVKQRIGQVFRYAIAHGKVEHDPTSALRGALAPVVSTSRAAITDPAKVGELLRAIEGYQGQPVTHAALRLAPLLFVRPGELRHAEWSEIDLDAAVWRIPAGKMKMREGHIVPLAPQAVAILNALKPLTGRYAYVFPSLRTASRPMSENTINAALRRLGYDKATMTGHGFRALASTRLNELGWAPDLIERQLAHAERNKVRAAYNRAQYLDERKKMMSAWADYLDGLRAGGKVIAINRKAQ
ncbi:MAG: tyrosine-type recombinase/integrase [Xanthomonadaceae bacterium]|nr:tyrosine-type recombinase/integrase [Xanthomonadaceae bacterium]